MFANLPKSVTIREMGPREGIQSEAQFIPTDQKLELIRALLKAGLKYIQVTSFTHPKVIPQFADAEKLMEQLERPEGIFYWATCPNIKGLERAINTGIHGITAPVSVTDGHNIVNVQRKTADTLKEFEVLVKKAKDAKIHVTGVMSAVFGCPIEGYVSPHRVLEVAKRLQWMGVDALSFGDTTGMANPLQVKSFFEMILAEFPGMDIMTHFHDTRGTGLANVLAAIDAGVTIHDCGLCGLGGQPSTTRKLYAYGRLGNINTEDLVSMLEEMGIRTGIDLDKLIEAAKFFEKIIGRELPGFVKQAGPVKALWGGGKEYLDYFIETFGYKES